MRRSRCLREILWIALIATAPRTCSALELPPPPLDELVRRSSSIFSGVVIEVGPSLVPERTIVERRVPVPPWERASLLRSQGVDITHRTTADTLVNVNGCGGGTPHLVTYSMTARWKGTQAGSVRLLSYSREKVGDHWLIFASSGSAGTYPAALDSVTPLPERQSNGSRPIDRAAHDLYRLSEPQWKDESRSPWPLVFDALIQQVKEGDPATAMSAARQLADTGVRQAEAAEALAVLLTRAEADSVAQAAVAAMWDLSEVVQPWLGAALDHPQPVVRRAAMRGIRLVHREASAAIGVLRVKLSDPDAQVRTSAAEALAGFEFCATPAYEELLVACADSDKAVRSISAAAIGFIGMKDARALESLLSLLHDPEPVVRMSAGNALGFLGTDNERVRGALYETLCNDSHPAACEGAEIGLRRLDTHWRERELEKIRRAPTSRHRCDPDELR